MLWQWCRLVAVIRAHLTCPLLSRLARRALLRQHTRSFVWMRRRRAPKPEAWVVRWRRVVLLLGEGFTLGSQTLKYFAERRRQVAAAAFAEAKSRVPA